MNGSGPKIARAELSVCSKDGMKTCSTDAFLFLGGKQASSGRLNGSGSKIARAELSVCSIDLKKSKCAFLIFVCFNVGFTVAFFKN